MSGLIRKIVADWVLTPEGWIHGGAILIDESTKGVIGFEQYHSEESCKTTRFDGCAIIPGLVNAHTHLELSTFRFERKFGNYFEWVERVIAHKNNTSLEDTQRAFKESINFMFRSGTQMCGDITNIPINPTEVSIKPEAPYDKFSFSRHIFWELLGFNVHDIVDSLSDEQKELFLDRKNIEHISLIPHAVYSTSERLIKQTYRWSRSRNRPFSIHVGEHEEELQFLFEGKGPCRELLEKLGRWNPKWSPPGISPVKYLDAIGALDSRTMLVHCVHLSEEDWDIVAQRNCFVCFCPRSNENLNVGHAKVKEAFKRKIRVCIGTDSLASNEDLNMFKEIAFFHSINPSANPDDILLSATYIPLSFFNSGTSSLFLIFELKEDTAQKNISETIMELGTEGNFKWMDIKSDWDGLDT